MTPPGPPSYTSPILPLTSSPSPSSSASAYPKPPFINKKSSTIITFHEPSDSEIANEQDQVASSLPSHMKSTSFGLASSSGSGSGSGSASGPSSLPLSRTNSNSSSLAEEGDLPPSSIDNLNLNINSNGEDRSQFNTNRAGDAGDADEAGADENTGLISGKAKKKWYKGPYFVTAVKFSILFTIFTVVVVCTFYFGMPKLDEEDKGVVKLPRSFADLQALNTLFQKYKTRYPFRILACAVVTYLFVQTFTLPGSMYISILFGAAYGMVYGLILSCLCDAFGSLLCYTLSSLLAPPLLTMPFYRARVETWRIKIMGDPKKGKKVTWDSVFAFLLVLRIAPFPPHWVANFVAPHLGIGMFMFWSSCFIGIAPVSVIHVTIGSSLDSMTSAADFHILSLRNILGLLAVVVAVLIPVGLKRVFKKDLGDLGEAEEVFTESNRDERDIDVPPINGTQGRRYHAIDSGVVLSLPSKGDGMGNKLIKAKGRQLEIIHDEDEDEYDDEEGYEGYEGYVEEDGEDGRFGELEERLLDAQQGSIGHEPTPSQSASGSGSGSGSGIVSPMPAPAPPSVMDERRPSWENQYTVYDPSGQIHTVTYNPTRTRSRSSSNANANSHAQRPKSMKRHNTNLSTRSKSNKNYGSITSRDSNGVEI
ncbi:uncharacterized protein I303_107175 [Kwoniella dejecticola CBS 10117]|uniref:Transmembrane protein n=1 Tax=Kwoniella dejecticola CBS 10117 TaxID=1296121 RepID=A0A1A5ZYX9_9TREE|nr:uncharacterized protein I303_06577 [Kwoniella dejecticola CBS 10117]OBR83018.1 transmembrane protein [Kwoniella dejecticola CBS 10117]